MSNRLEMGRHAAPALPPVLDDLDVLKRCFRDIVALSTLPAMWSGADPRRIAESLASSLFTTLDPALVYVGISPPVGEPPISVAQTGRYRVDPALAAELGADVAGERGVRDIRRRGQLRRDGHARVAVDSDHAPSDVCA